MASIGYFILALLIFGLFVLVHEAGHFLAARAVGIGVKEFALGFGPKIISWHRKETRYSLRAVPMGGFCQFYGEDEESDRPDAFRAQKVWKRMLVTVAGPFMNVVLAYIAMAALMMMTPFIMGVPSIYEVVPDSPAQQAGIMAGDIITQVNGQDISFDGSGLDEMMKILDENGAAQVLLLLNRQGESLAVNVQPRQNENGDYLMGISLGQEYYCTLPEALWGGAINLWEMTRSMVGYLGNMLTTGEGLSETTGAVGMISVATQAVRQGIEQVLYLIVVISLNLGIVNLLPIPALDGGHLLIYVVEAVRRKPLNPRHEGYIQGAGFLIIITIFVLVTWQDITRLIAG